MTSTRDKGSGTDVRRAESGSVPTSAQSEIDAFIRQVRATPAGKTGSKPGRLLFAMDATASREPTWDRACHIQSEMFSETAALGGLSVQLAYYRGFGEFSASAWMTDTKTLLREMTGVTCRGGQTQIARLLDHIIKETGRERIQAAVFVGDAFEDDLDAVCHRAGQLGMLGVPLFIFHEGGDGAARRAFEEVARLTKGACCPFDSHSAQQLKDLLAAVAVYAAGGRRALESFSERRGGTALLLTHRFGR